MMLAGFMSLLCMTACAEEIPQDSQTMESPESQTEPIAETEPDFSETVEEIYWLSDYDLNPIQGQQRSTALALFEDQYHGKVTWIWCDPELKSETLTSRIQSGEPVDMVSYDMTDFPVGVLENQYQPLDAYLDLTDPIWNDMQDAIENYAYQGEHYVIPYATENNLLLIYDKNLCQKNSLADPYALYQSGEWTWDTFQEMMQEFVAKNPGYCISGNIGRGILQSTGVKILGGYENHLNDPAVTAAENFLQEISDAELYTPEFYSNAQENILFYAMEDWALDRSNAMNPDADYMAVPFPKAPDAEQYYLSGTHEAKMLVKNSEKGNAVAAYIYCERLAHTDPAYQEAAKQNALTGQTSAAGQVLSYRTEEQYNAIQSYQTDLELITDPGYGMGSILYGNGEYTYETKGVMNRLEESILKDQKTWEQILADCQPLLDTALENYDKVS